MQLLIPRYPKMYVGISEGTYEIVKIVLDFSKVSERDILITFKKIKQNDSMERIAHDFGIKKTAVSNIFNNNIKKISPLLEELTFWPQKKTVAKMLPISFRKNYCNVCSIIDCFEIQIEKLSNAKYQAMTYSRYKSCNTAKYLVACTPHGMITFISEGFGGRISNLAICQKSGFFNKLPERVGIMSDRGF